MIYVWSKCDNDRSVEECMISFARLNNELCQEISKLPMQNIVKVITGRLLVMGMTISPILSKLHPFNALLSLMGDYLYCSVMLSPPNLYVTINLNGHKIEDKFTTVDGQTKYDVQHFLHGSHLSVTVTGLSNVVIQNTFRLLDGGIGADIVDWIKKPASVLWGDCDIVGGCGVAIADSKIDNACAYLVLDFTDKKLYATSVRQNKDLKFPSRVLFSGLDLFDYLNITEDMLKLDARIKFDSPYTINLT